MSKPKLVHIITGLGVGGAETFLLRLSADLLDRYSIEVVSLSGNGPIGMELSRLGIPVHLMGMRPLMPSPFKLWRLIRLLRAIRPAIVHSWMYHADLLGGIAARLAGVPVVLWGIRHSNLSPEANKRTTLLVARLCGFLSSFVPRRITCVAAAARDAHIDFGYSMNRIVVIPNGFNTDIFRPDPDARRSVRDELGLSENTPLIGVIARFDAQKGHIVFTDVAQRLMERVPGARFLLAGAGIDAGNGLLMRWLECRNLRDNVILLGRRKDVNRLMAALDILLLPSVGEGLPNVVGEAMACGVPCVATDVGDTAVLIGDTGLVRASGDIAGLAGALADLLALPPPDRVALGLRARQRIIDHYKIDGIVERYHRLYCSVMAQNQA